MIEKTCNCDPCLEWLVPHDAEVTANERERIIKLLELNVAYSVQIPDGGNKNILETEELIALIKGEENDK